MNRTLAATEDVGCIEFWRDRSTLHRMPDSAHEARSFILERWKGHWTGH